MPDNNLKNYTRSFNVSRVDAPPFIKEFLNHLLIVEGLSGNTVRTYYWQLFDFFRWIIANRTHFELNMEEIEIADMPFKYIEELEQNNIFDYFAYVTMEKNNAATSLSLKFAAIHHFFSYHTKISKSLEKDVTAKIKAPKKRKTIPKYLTVLNYCSLSVEKRRKGIL